MTSNAATNIVVITIAQALPFTNSSSPNFRKMLNKVASIPAKYKAQQLHNVDTML